MTFSPQAPSPVERARIAERAGLCSSCRFLQLLASKRSTFVRCGRHDHDRTMAKYPPLPVLGCRGFEPEGGPSGG